MDSERESVDYRNEALDPVAAYDAIAPQYSELSAERSAYLAAVEKSIVSQIPNTARSMLDIGSGDGVRGLRIAKQAGIKDVVLLEPSPAMRAQISQDAEIWPIRAEALANYAGARERRFDVITCLWNVLGHLPADDRKEVLRQVHRLLSPTGTFFVDLIHRYNIRSYGLIKTTLRYLKDRFAPNPANGDVIVRWKTQSRSCTTQGHVFTNTEMLALAKTAGLKPKMRVAIDYETGEIRPLAFQGNLLYAFRRISEIESASAATTSSTFDSVI